MNVVKTLLNFYDFNLLFSLFWVGEIGGTISSIFCIFDGLIIVTLYRQTNLFIIAFGLYSYMSHIILIHLQLVNFH